VAKKPLAKKVAAKKAATKPTQKSPAKKIGTGKSILKTAGKIASKAVAVLTKADKEKAKKEAMKAKILAQKEKERLKKEAEKAKLQAKKEKERLKKEAEKAKLQAKKEKELQKKEAEKQKILAEKEAEKAKKLAEKEAEKAKKLAEKNAEKSKKLNLKNASSPKMEEGEVKRRAYEIDEDEDDLLALEKSKPSKEGRSKYEIQELELKIVDEIEGLREHFSFQEITNAIGTMEFFVDPKDDSCIEKSCDNIRTTLSWCRLHYIKNWKNIQRKQEILKEGRLQEYLQDLLSKYPTKYIEAIIKDLSDERDFYRILNELNITAEFEYEEEDFDSANDDDDSADDIGIESTFTGSMRYEDTE
jgi:hypothetical protein